MCRHSDKRYVLDRFEADNAVLIADDGDTLAVPGLGGREGDVFAFQDGAWLPLPHERAARAARILAKRDRLFGKKQGA